MITLATRVLNTIREKDRIIGFRVICSLKDNKGIHILSLSHAKVFYKSIEKFENVKYVGNNQWEGLECGLDRFPSQNKVGDWLKGADSWFILGRMYDDGKLVGYKLMDLLGEVHYSVIDNTIQIGLDYGFVNAKVVQKDNDYVISALRGKFREFEVKDNVRHLLHLAPKKVTQPVQTSLFDSQLNMKKDGVKVLDDKTKKERYVELSQMFAKKEKGEITDADIARKVGATSGKDYSQKIHEYLDEPMTMSDRDILNQLYLTYKNSQAIKSTPVVSPVQSQPVNSIVDNPDVARMRDLISELTKAAEVYYSGEDEIMSNYEYDEKYDELEKLEKKTGIVLAGSLTQKVGFQIISKLPKVKHPSKMLSLDKTKDRNDLANSLGGQPGFLGWKLDGLTIALTYENGEFVSAVTRGDGITGEDVTHNAKFFKGVPFKISYTDRLVVRGEALISRKRFDEINAKITNIDDKYKNARNLASGSVRQQDSKIAKERGVEVVAFSVYEGFDHLDNYSDKLDELRKYGFDVVPFIRVKTKDDVIKGIEDFEGKVQGYKFPTDGLVITIDNIAYGEMLGTTAKYPKNSKAFKWKDEDSESELKDIEWSVGRTGAITPVAIFKPVEIDGTTVQRASLHNVSVFKDMLGSNAHIGQKVSIIKSNMIIPQVVKADKTTTGVPFVIPNTCPICGGMTEIVKSKDAEVLMCTNADCPAQHLGLLSHFVSRDCMNIEGLSESTLERFVNEGYIKDFKDIYHLNDYEKDIINLEGFGKGSYSKLWKAIEKSRDCELPAFINALGIAQMGKTTSKDVCKALDYDLEKLMDMSEQQLQGIDGVGAKTAKEIANYFGENKSMVAELAKEMNFKVMPKIDRNSPIAGLIFCITGDVYTFKNRKELQAKIESLGAKASSSVSSKTNYLINNDVTSGSNKNQTAKKLGVPIISEADFLKMIGE